jgi:hypothetical protein
MSLISITLIVGFNLRKKLNSYVKTISSDERETDASSVELNRYAAVKIQLVYDRIHNISNENKSNIFRTVGRSVIDSLILATPTPRSSRDDGLYVNEADLYTDDLFYHLHRQLLTI